MSATAEFGSEDSDVDVADGAKAHRATLLFLFRYGDHLDVLDGQEQLIEGIRIATGAEFPFVHLRLIGEQDAATAEAFDPFQHPADETAALKGASAGKMSVGVPGRRTRLGEEGCRTKRRRFPCVKEPEETGVGDETEKE